MILVNVYYKAVFYNNRSMIITQNISRPRAHYMTVAISLVINGFGKCVNTTGMPTPTRILFFSDSKILNMYKLTRGIK